MCRAWGSVTGPTTRQIPLGLTGWVRNESDGSVTMEVQGEEQAIRVLLETIENGHYIEIENHSSKQLPLTPLGPVL